MQAERLEETRLKAGAVRAVARAPEWTVPAIKTLLVAFDLLLACVCFVAAFYFREGEAILARSSDGRLAWDSGFAPYAALLALVLVIRLLTLAYYDLYSLRGEYSYVDEAARVFKATATGSLLIVAAAFLFRGGFEYRAFSYARGVFLLDFAFALGVFAALRFALRASQTFVRRRGINLIPTLVVGRGEEAAQCIEEMRDHPELGYRVIGVVVNDASDHNAPEEFAGVPVVCGVDDLTGAIRETKANEVIIADVGVSSELLFNVMMRVGRERRVEFRIAPNLFNCLPRKTEIDQIGHLPMIRLFREPLSSAARVAKRLSDILIATFALCVFAPAWLIVAILIKLDSRGAVLYKQERVGMDGRIFLIYKFRTMSANADDRQHREFQRRYIEGHPETNLGDSERPVYKLHTDPRVTRSGRVLRRLSLDELPQLLNVLRGDMSIVGPRPPIPYEVEAYELWHRKRLDMKPGVTGLWQVSGRNRLSFDDMVRLDLFYIENWSPLLDLRIILRTLPVMLRGDDAY